MRGGSSACPRVATCAAARHRAGQPGRARECALASARAGSDTAAAVRVRWPPREGWLRGNSGAKPREATCATERPRTEQWMAPKG
eukprot:3788214-Prymnesium_polylepis.1